MRRCNTYAYVAGVSVLTCLVAHALAEPGVHQDRIVFGRSVAVEGPAAALGLGMRLGVLAAF